SRLFPGVHHRAVFTVHETKSSFSVSLKSKDGEVDVAIAGNISEKLPSTSVFSSLEEASAFFEAGSLGYSVTRSPHRFDGMELRCKNWKIQPLAVDSIRSSFFEDKSRFPEGSVKFDCALLMSDINHEWLGREDLCCTNATNATLTS
ncbi:MAG: hypothetical protein AABZ60_06675, partial [Planctomycetota bacterium]